MWRCCRSALPVPDLHGNIIKVTRGLLCLQSKQGWECQSCFRMTIEATAQKASSGLISVRGARSAVCITGGLQNWTAPSHVVQ